MKSERLPARILFGLLGTVLFRYPFWAFQFDAGDLRQVKPWTNDFFVMCPADCGIYSLLSKSYGINDSVFFPGYPLLLQGLRSFLDLTGREATLLASNLFTLVCGILILFLGDTLWKQEKAKRFGFKKTSWLFLFAFSIFPNGHFWMQGFSEPFFLTWVLTALLLVSKEKWRTALVSLGISAIIRPQGVWLLGFFSLYYLWKRWGEYKEGQKDFRDILKDGFAFFIAAIPLLGFMTWLYRESGNPVYFLSLQKSGWGRELGLWAGIKHHLPQKDLLVSAYLYISLAATWIFIKRRDPIWKIIALFSFALADLPLFVGGYLSYVRFISVNVGLFALLAEYCRNRVGVALALATFGIVRLAIQVYHSAQGWWVG